MDTEKRIEELETMLRRLESRYSQSNPVDVMALRALKREIKRLQALVAEGKTEESKPTSK
jgi:hypothetical protein